MKRTSSIEGSSQSSFASQQTSQYNGSKKVRKDSEDLTFEEELMLMDDMLPAEVYDSSEGCENKLWARPSVVESMDTKNSIAFQWLDIDMTTAEAMNHNPDGGKVLGSTSGIVPVIRLYGVTQSGQSICANVHGFTPYIFVALPLNADLSDASLSSLRAYLDARMKEKARGEEKKISESVLAIQKISGLQSLLGYHFDEVRDFIKVFVAMPSLVPGLKRLFDDGVPLSGMGSARCQTYESNVPFVLRFMIDNDISGANWLELKENSYEIKKTDDCKSRCSFEVDVFFNNIIAHLSDGPWSSIAPLRVLSFDIECEGRKGHFPDANFDPVIQIANTITLQGSDTPIIRNVFTLKGCLPIVGAQVIPSDDEYEMLMKWRSFVLSVDPDIITGYNIANFDIPYLLNRAKVILVNAKFKL